MALGSVLSLTLIECVAGVAVTIVHVEGSPAEYTVDAAPTGEDQVEYEGAASTGEDQDEDEGATSTGEDQDEDEDAPVGCIVMPMV